jgi:hypothetical protein
MVAPEFCVRWLFSYVLISHWSLSCHVVTRVAITSTTSATRRREDWYQIIRGAYCIHVRGIRVNTVYQAHVQHVSCKAYKDDGKRTSTINTSQRRNSRRCKVEQST